MNQVLKQIALRPLQFITMPIALLYGVLRWCSDVIRHSIQFMLYRITYVFWPEYLGIARLGVLIALYGASVVSPVAYPLFVFLRFTNVVAVLYLATTREKGDQIQLSDLLFPMLLASTSTLFLLLNYYRVFALTGVALQTMTLLPIIALALGTWSCVISGKSRHGFVSADDRALIVSMCYSGLYIYAKIMSIIVGFDISVLAPVLPILRIATTSLLTEALLVTPTALHCSENPLESTGFDIYETVFYAASRVLVYSREAEGVMTPKSLLPFHSTAS